MHLVMAKRSRGIPDKEKDAYTCARGVSGLLRSCQLLTTSPKLISNGRDTARLHSDHSRRLVQLNEECPSNRSEIQEDKHSIIEGQWYTDMDSELVHCLAKSHKRSQNNSCQLSSPHLNYADALSDLLSKYFQSSIHRRKNDQADRISIQQVQMSAKAIADQMFIDSLIHKQAKNFRPNSVSNTLRVLNSDKDLFVDLLLDRNSLLSRRRKKAHASQTEEETKAELDLGSKTSIIAQPRDEIVILKPDVEYTKRSECIACHCSPVLSGRTVSDDRKKTFSFRGMKKRLKHTFGGTRREGTSYDSVSQGMDSKSSFDRKKQELHANRASDIACETEMVGKKLDLSSFEYSMKQEFDVVLEAKRHLSARLKNVKDVETVDNDKSSRTLRWILASPEHDLWRSPGRESQQCSCCAQMRFSPYNSSTGANGSSPRKSNGRKRVGLNPSGPNAEVTSCDNAKKTSQNQSTCREACETNEKCYGNSISRDIARSMENFTELTKLHKEDENLTENEVFISTMDDPDANKFQEEHQSPVSVLHPMFREDAKSPQSIPLQTAQQLHLDFEEPSLKSSNTSSSMEVQDHRHQFSEILHSVLQASCLNWDLLSKTTCVPEKLLCFDQVQLLHGDCHFDPNLVFDLINEVLLSIHWTHFCFPPRLTSMELKIMSAPLQEVVLDKIMAKAEFHLLPWTSGKRTLVDTVSEDVTNCGSWLDVRLDTEQIAVDISEDFLEACILDMILEYICPA